MCVYNTVTHQDDLETIIGIWTKKARQIVAQNVHA